MQDLNDFADLDDLDGAAVKRGSGRGHKRAPVNAAEERSEACPKCNGTGRFVGWSGRVVGDCHTCNGAGKVRPTTLKRHNAQQSAEAYRREHGFGRPFADSVGGEDKAREIVDFLRDAASWSEFYASLSGQLAERGKLSPKQIAAVVSGKAKIEAKRAAKARAEADVQGAVDADADACAPLFEAFRAASAHLKRPKLIYGHRRILISLAPASGKNAGCLYVKHAGEYAGKIDPQRGFLPLRSAGDEVVDHVRAIAADPAGEIKVSGLKFGSCGCCGRELTNPVSVERGIGPICEQRYGF